MADYDLSSRSAKRDRVQIRELLGFRQATVEDGTDLSLRRGGNRNVSTILRHLVFEFTVVS
jgi:hypothetical protein